MNRDLSLKFNQYFFVMLFGIRAILYVAEKFYQLLLLFDWVSSVLNCVILISAFFLPTRKRVGIALWNFTLVILLIVNGMSSISYSEKNMFDFQSPNQKNTLLIEECSFLLGGWSNVYQEKFFIFKKELNGQGWISTDDGYQPFSRNDYSIIWIDDNHVEIVYGYGNADIRKTVNYNLE